MERARLIRPHDRTIPSIILCVPHTGGRWTVWFENPQGKGLCAQSTGSQPIEARRLIRGLLPWRHNENLSTVWSVLFLHCGESPANTFEAMLFLAPGFMFPSAPVSLSSFGLFVEDGSMTSTGPYIVRYGKAIHLQARVLAETTVSPPIPKSEPPRAVEDAEDRYEEVRSDTRNLWVTVAMQDLHSSDIESDRSSGVPTTTSAPCPERTSGASSSPPLTSGSRFQKTN